jgi:hypothetical protein
MIFKVKAEVHGEHPQEEEMDLEEGRLHQTLIKL